MDKHSIAITKIIPKYEIVNKSYLMQTHLQVEFIYNNSISTIDIKTSKIDGSEIKDKIIEVITG